MFLNYVASSRAAGRPRLALVFEVVDFVSKFVIATHTNPLQRLKNKNRCGTATLVFENPPSQR
jgi:hypothetical protein